VRIQKAHVTYNAAISAGGSTMAPSTRSSSGDAAGCVLQVIITAGSRFASSTDRVISASPPHVPKVCGATAGNDSTRGCRPQGLDGWGGSSHEPVCNLRGGNLRTAQVSGGSLQKKPGGACTVRSACGLRYFARITVAGIAISSRCTCSLDEAAWFHERLVRLQRRVMSAQGAAQM